MVAVLIKLKWIKRKKDVFYFQIIFWYQVNNDLVFFHMRTQLSFIIICNDSNHAYIVNLNLFLSSASLILCKSLAII